MLAPRPIRRHLRRLRHERPDVAMMLAFGAVLAVLSVLPALLGLAGIDFGSRTVPPAELLAEAVVEGEHHLVFMDCNMPGLSGFDATRLIRVRESGKEYRTIVIAMTANARASTREHCLEAGMDDYITKPVRAGVLAEVLDRWKAGGEVLS